MSRTGCQTYGDIVEYRPDSEVFAPASLETLPDVPLTRDHPPESVSPANWRKYTVGHVSEIPAVRTKLDGSPHEWVQTPIVISDGDVIAAVERGDAIEVSAGYSCDLDFTPGVAPDGTKYDAVQRNIRFNHLAVIGLGQARAGADARLRLDNSKEIMKVIVIDGVEYEVGSEKHLAKLTADAKSAADKAQAALDTLQAKHDTLSAECAALKAAASPDKLDALVLERFTLLTAAAKFLPKTYETKGKTNADVRKDALEAVLGAGSMNDKSPEYIAARFDGLTDPVKAQYTGTVPAARSDAVKEDSDEEFRKALAAKAASENK